MIDKEKIKHTIDVIRLAAKMSRQYYEAPLIVTYSGGKDSDVLADIAIKSGAEVEFLNSHTTVDAPETVYHIRKKFRNFEERGYKTKIKMPDETMWELIEERKIPPSRFARYCCSVLKEQSTPHRFIATGIRKDESRQRATRNEFEIRGKTKKTAQLYTYEHTSEVYIEAQEKDEIWDCNFIKAAKKNKSIICNPIFNWTEKDVWNYIRENKIEYNPLYDRGYTRVGCIGCPLGGRKSQLRAFADYPKYKEAYIRAFQRMIERRKNDGLRTDWKTGEECFLWWIDDPNIPGQMDIKDFIK